MIDQFDILVTENNDDVTVNVTNNLEEVVDIFVAEGGEEIELNITNNIVELNIIRGAVNLSLTTNNNSGAATYDNITGVFNIPNYTLAGLGGQAALNGLGFVKINGTTISYDNSTYLTTINGIAAGGELSGTYPNPTLVNSAVTGKLLSGVNITGGTIQATDSILTAFGKVQNQINGLIGGTIFQGLWNASTNSPSLASSVGSNGHYYIVSVAGSTNLNGITDWNVGDWAIFSGTSWQKVDNTDAVVSVNGFTGAVSLTTSNITEGTNLYYTDARVRTAISLTTTGTSGAATYNNTTGVFNIPQYAPDLSGFVPYTGATANVNLGTHALLAKDLVINHSSGSGVAASITKNGSGEALTVVKGSGSGNAASITGGITLLTTLNLTNALADSFIASAATWNAKQNAITLTTTGTSGAATLVGATLNIPQYADQFVGTVTSVGLTSSTSGVTIGSSPITTSGNITLAIATASGSQQGLLSSTDWTTFNNKQNALTNPITGTGTTNFLPKFTGASTLGNSAIQDNTSSIVYTFSSNPVLNITDGTRSSFFGTATTAGAYVNASQVGDAFIRANNGIVFSGANGTGGELRLDASGNLGLGVTPSAWASPTYRAFQIGSTAALFSASGQVLLDSNSFVNTSFLDIYTATGFATRYQQVSGQHRWFNAPSGTAGNAISFTQAMTLDASGNLFIGATSNYGSGARLNVQGGSIIASSSTWNNSNTGGAISMFSDNANYGTIWALKDGNQAWGNIAIAPLGGNVGIGTTSPNNKLYIVSSAQNSGLSVMDWNGAGGWGGGINLGVTGLSLETLGKIYTSLTNGGPGSVAGDLRFQTATGGALFDRMTITSGGNVGIGTSPAYKLHVVTDAVAGRQNMSNISRTTGNWVRFTNPQYSTDASMGLLLRVFPDSDARQGAGIIASGGSNNAVTNLDLFVTTSPDGLGGTSYSALRIDGLNGNVGIGTTSPSERLTVSGNVLATAFFTSSDITLKNIIKTSYNPTGIEAISYKWKDSGIDTKVHVGYSAQQVQEFMPDAVSKDSNGKLSVNYVEVLVAKIAALEAEVKLLKAN
jgi:hypothetical protein